MKVIDQTEQKNRLNDMQKGARVRWMNEFRGNYASDEEAEAAWETHWSRMMAALTQIPYGVSLF